MRSIALAFAVVLALVPPSGAQGAHSRCPHARVVLRSQTGVVFTRQGNARTVYYGCLFSVRKTFRLQQVGEYGLNNLAAETLRMAGRYVAYQQDYGSIGGQVNTISVRDLRTGVVVHQDTVSQRGGDWGDGVTTLVLRADGAIAWTTVTTEDYQHQTVELRAMSGPGKPRLVAESAEIAPRSLRLTPDRRSIQWQRGGVEQRAAL